MEVMNLVLKRKSGPFIPNGQESHMEKFLLRLENLHNLNCGNASEPQNSASECAQNTRESVVYRFVFSNSSSLKIIIIIMLPVSHKPLSH